MLRPLLCAVGFLTRIPVPAQDYSEAELAQSAGLFAWVGGIIAGALWLTSLLSARLGERSTALLVVVVWAILSNGLHLDGLADSVDGLSGGRGVRERVLEIMRDSRVGSHGALALVLLVSLKWTALETLLGQGRRDWLLAPVLARFMATLLIACFPYVRGQGLGSAFSGRVGLPALLLGSLATGGALWFCGPSALGGAAAGVAAALLVAWRFRVLLGGLTGDVYGAAIEVSEAACLLALSLR